MKKKIDKFTFVLFQNTHTISLIYTIQYLLNRSIREFQKESQNIYKLNIEMVRFSFPSLKGLFFC